MVEDQATHRIMYRDVLLAFRFIAGSHKGENIASAFLAILTEYKISHKVCARSGLRLYASILTTFTDRVDHYGQRIKQQYDDGSS